MRSLLLAPHNDDETLFASFICLRYQPQVIVCYTSEVQQDLFGVTAEERMRETHEAMGILGCHNWRQWAFGDLHGMPEEIEANMWGLRDPAGQDDWEIVFAPAHETNGNTQHNLIAELARTVFSDVEIRSYLTYTNPPLVRSRSDKRVSTEPEWLFLKHQALACYRSQAKTPSHRHFAEDLMEYWA